MKRSIILFLLILSLLCVSCKSNSNIGSNTKSTDGRIQVIDFEEYLKYATDFIEGKFVSYRIENGIVYCTFKVINDYRENGLSGDITAHYSAGETSVSSNEIPFASGVSYLLLLSRQSSVFTEGDDFGFVSRNIIIPADGYEKSATLRGDDLRGFIKTQEALDAFDNGRLAEYIKEAVKDNPRIADGIPYTVSSDPKEIIAFSDYVFKVKIDDLESHSLKGDRITGYCIVEETMKGDLDNTNIMITFPMGQVEQGSSYIVAVCGSGSFFVVSSKNSVFNCSEYDTVKELIDNE